MLYNNALNGFHISIVLSPSLSPLSIALLLHFVQSVAAMGHNPLSFSIYVLLHA
jgi:hypothetical protein